MVSMESGPIGDQSKNIIVLGNLQSGKTTLFRHLCKQHSKEIEIPRSSVSLNRGKIALRGGDKFYLIDTPGTSTFFPQGEEDMVARDALLWLNPVALLVVADAKNLRRSLALVAHAAEFGIPMVLAVNMEDEAWRYGMSIDLGLLETQLGIDVVATVATQGLGIRRLLDKLKTPKVPRRILEFPRAIRESLEEIEAEIKGLGQGRRGLAGLLLAGDSSAEKMVAEFLGDETLEKIRKIVGTRRADRAIPPEVQITESLYGAAGTLTGQVVAYREVRGRLLDTFGRMAHHPVLGLVVAILVVYFMYLWVGKIGATLVVDWIGKNIFHDILIPAVDNLTKKVPFEIVRDLLMDEDFGLIPTGLFLAFGLVMPILFFFYFAFNILVTLGYLPRLSVLLDRVFRVIGLNGKGILPLTMGFSCVTMALITTRMLDSKKEQIIASFLLLLGTPCAPLMAMIFVILAPMSYGATLSFYLIIISQKLFAGAMVNKMLKGDTSDFIMVIPPVRLPRIGRVLRQTARQTYYFMKEAVPLFLVASLVLFVVDRLGGLDLLERASHPVVNGLLGLPDSSVQVFIKTMIRRETGAGELELVRKHFDNVQLFVTLLVMTFLIPCINTTMVLIKERGIKVASVLLVSVSVYALGVGTVANAVCRFFNVTFS